ncbi:actin nucleation-promoting factor WASL-like [Psammomys obesus]|uniref:actin nucleation-promoting factor WASL-like n=1 Tax=Psammomys obesus TaxID=48139 RepID=UPI002452E78B|nr:actin nucleation-promoting factor WASL-like [Psammomys obesus]
MSLPLRLPYCSPARRLRAALLYPYFRAPATPPPSPAYSQEPDSELEGCTPESYPEEEARHYEGGRWGRVMSGPPSCPPTSQPWHRQPPPPPPPPPHIAAPDPPPASPQVAVPWRSHSIRPTVLGRRPSVAQGPRRAKERQPGTASAGGKEQELRVSSQTEWRLRSLEEPTLEALVPRTWPIGGVSGRSMCPGKRNGKLSRPAWASPEKYQGSCRRVTLDFKVVEKPR